MSWGRRAELSAGKSREAKHTCDLRPATKDLFFNGVVGQDEIFGDFSK